MDKPEVSNDQEIKNMIKVRNELGWQEINDFITWLNPGGLRDSLWGFSTRDILSGSGWAGIDEFIKQRNESGTRPSLLR